MLIVFAGEDSSTSRTQLLQSERDYVQKGYVFEKIISSDIENIYKMGTGVTNLFGQSIVYSLTNLSKSYSPRNKAALANSIKSLADNKNIILLDWEDGKSAYELSSLKKISSAFYEAKPVISIFQLLESCFPKNLNQFLSHLQMVGETQDEMFIYTLLWKHVRKLLQVTEGKVDSSIAPWQRSKLDFQARKWEKVKLLKFYEGLARIDIALKTGSTNYNVYESIELLTCYYLKS